MECQHTATRHAVSWSVLEQYMAFTRVLGETWRWAHFGAQVLQLVRYDGSAVECAARRRDCTLTCLNIHSEGSAWYERTSSSVQARGPRTRRRAFLVSRHNKFVVSICNSRKVLRRQTQSRDLAYTRLSRDLASMPLPTTSRLSLSALSAILPEDTWQARLPSSLAREQIMPRRQNGRPR